MFHKTFVQIAEFDWLSERQKGLIFFEKKKEKKIKSSQKPGG